MALGDLVEMQTLTQWVWDDVTVAYTLISKDGDNYFYID